MHRDNHAIGNTPDINKTSALSPGARKNKDRTQTTVYVKDLLVSVHASARVTRFSIRTDYSVKIVIICIGFLFYITLRYHLSECLVFFSHRLVFYHVISRRARRKEPGLVRIVYAGRAMIVTVERASRTFSEGERGGSSFAGVMVHTAHSRRLEKRKPRAKHQARERRAVMHAIMRINELWRYLWLYQARSTAPLPTPPRLFHPESSFARSDSPALSRIKPRDQIKEETYGRI